MQQLRPDCEGGCVQGMNLMDFFHLRDRIWKAGAGDPQGNNTLFLGPEHAAIKELRTGADVDWLKPDLELMSAEPVIYLGARFGSDV